MALVALHLHLLITAPVLPWVRADFSNPSMELLLLWSREASLNSFKNDELDCVAPASVAFCRSAVADMCGAGGGAKVPELLALA
jgi:hypothetical protein